MPSATPLVETFPKGVTYPTVWEESLTLLRLPTVKELTAELHDCYS
jgi:hypothetical protein